MHWPTAIDNTGDQAEVMEEILMDGKDKRQVTVPVGRIAVSALQNAPSRLSNALICPVNIVFCMIGGEISCKK